MEKKRIMKENLFEPNKIRTFSGLYVNPFEMKESNINIVDIAHSLSNQCRFAGHLPKFYSVAQHCVLCCYRAPKGFKLTALLHDASEAYLLDIPRPIKNQMPFYKEAESRIMELVAVKYGFKYPLSKVIHEIDQNMLIFEWENLMLRDIRTGPYYTIQTPEQAELTFLEAFKLLAS